MLKSMLILLVRPDINILNVEQYSIFKCIIYRIEPVMLIGEREYNLNALIEIEASDSYLSLDEDVRECHNEESVHNCTTRNYIDNMRKQCSCLPLNIRLSNKVRVFYDIVSTVQ